MRAVLQRVSRASVTVDGAVTGAIDKGLLVLLAVGPQDSEAQVRWMADKIAGLRIFPDDEGRMNRSVVEAGGAALVVSQFTLYGDCRKGRRPSFVKAGPPDLANHLYERFCDVLGEQVTVGRGVFQAHMDVALVNDGPVTLILDTP